MRSTDDEALHRLAGAISVTMRVGRAHLGLSQRELSARTSMSQSTVARLESGTGDPRLSWVVSALAAVGSRLVLPEPGMAYRRDGEHVRDGQGRRLPAHLEAYRLPAPHTWWPGWSRATLWWEAPTWSYVRRRRGVSER